MMIMVHFFLQLDLAEDDGSTSVDGVIEGALRFSSGLILPPPEIKCAYRLYFSFKR
jgi:hypothetical protein